MGKRHKVCSKVECQKERKNRKWRLWAAMNVEVRKVKLRVWAKAYPHYWRHYRQRHPEYVARDNHRRCLSLRRQFYSAKQIQIKALVAERIQGIKNLLLEHRNSAKQTQLSAWVNSLAEYIIWRDSSAK